MEQLTTYRAKGKEIGLVFLFKYDLEGNLKAFEIETGELDEKQMNWLFRGYFPKDVADPLPNANQKEVNSKLVIRFPATEIKFKLYWLDNEDICQKFEIEQSPADLSFDALFTLFGHKVGRIDAIKSFNKLKQGDVIKCFIEVPYYLEYLKKNPGIAQLYLATYINKRRFEDERPQVFSKNKNPVLHNLAKSKTSK